MDEVNDPQSNNNWVRTGEFKYLLSQRIVLTPIPHHFHMPRLETYDTNTYPNEHVDYYRTVITPTCTSLHVVDGRCAKFSALVLNDLKVQVEIFKFDESLVVAAFQNELHIDSEFYSSLTR